MTERGMIFNAEMVRAILDGSKTQTRRIVKPQRVGDGWSVKEAQSPLAARHTHDWWLPTGTRPYSALPGCPYGVVGDRIWVRETWADVNHDGCPAVAYRADGEVRDLQEDDGEEDDPNLEKYCFANFYPDLISGTEGRWTPSIHMPRWASRITLEITAVRVERLSEISEADAAAEGVPPAGDLLPDHPGAYLTPKGDFATAKVAFQRFWESIYGDDSWQANPWVWVIEFRRVEGGAA
ncbi:hypothetical protein [Pseudescherichia vulneris]|uniref:hypothetical protein n=1 Tax=Pseudescherichia vulneris TaxID=566 RepID=UPI001EDCC4D2|nr:hypothetical protein [Pseudescherichia vulneris]